MYLLSMNVLISIVSMHVRIMFELSMDSNPMKHEILNRINQAEKIYFNQMIFRLSHLHVVLVISLFDSIVDNNPILLENLRDMEYVVHY